MHGVGNMVKCHFVQCCNKMWCIQRCHWLESVEIVLSLAVKCGVSGVIDCHWLRKVESVLSLAVECGVSAVIGWGVEGGGLIDRRPDL